MQSARSAHEHKTIYQQQRVEQHLERSIEEQRLDKLKANLQAKLESALPEKMRAA